jgi:hypothetical protein
MSQITLAEWAKQTDHKILKVRGSVGVCSTDQALWGLADYFVSSIAKGTTWLVPKDKMLRITPADALAEISRALGDTNHNPVGYHDRLMRMALPESVPITRGAMAIGTENRVEILNIAACRLWSDALYAWCENTIRDHGIAATCEGTGYTGYEPGDEVALADSMFEDYEQMLCGHLMA